MKLMIREAVRSADRVEQTQTVAEEFLVFTIDGQPYGVPVRRVRHVLPAAETPILPVKAKYEALVGFLEWKNELTPALNLARHLSSTTLDESFDRAPAKGKHDVGVVVLAEVRDITCALLAEGIQKVRSIPTRCIQEFPAEACHLRRAFYSGIVVNQEEILLLLDIDALFPEPLTRFLVRARSDFQAKRGSES